MTKMIYLGVVLLLSSLCACSGKEKLEEKQTEVEQELFKLSEVKVISKTTLDEFTSWSILTSSDKKTIAKLLAKISGGGRLDFVDGKTFGLDKSYLIEGNKRIAYSYATEEELVKMGFDKNLNFLTVIWVHSNERKKQ